jgi:hypothetical protein
LARHFEKGHVPFSNQRRRAPGVSLNISWCASSWIANTSWGSGDDFLSGFNVDLTPLVSIAR